MPALAKKPNFLVILADDLGYSDIGCFGSEIHTPHLDRMARDGLSMTDYHTAAVCSPTRSMLLSGTDCHMAGLGVMSEFRTIDPDRWNVPGHEGYMNHDVAALPEILQDNDYFTVMSGKWHLGWKDEFAPHNRGFDRSFVMVPGSTNHFGWEPAFEAQEGKRPTKFLPGHSLPLYTQDGVRWKPEPNTSSDPRKGFYSSSTYTDKLITMLGERKGAEAQKPFFAYLAFTAPHFPLQCSREDRDRYRGVYDEGPDALRCRRVKRMKELGIIGEAVEPHPVEAVTAEWADLTADEKRLSARSMEIFAGMVTAIDREVGKILDHLRDIGELDNTLVIFQSDNGAEGAAMEANPAMGPDLLAAIDKYYDNSLENLGNYNSFCWYGPRWAQASTAPSRLYKAYNTEGGIRVPMVMRYPGWTRLHGEGSRLPSFATVMDVAPTILQMAGAQHPNPHPSQPRDKTPYRGHQVYGMRGKSWVPWLQQGLASDPTHPAAAIHGSNDPPTGWEMFGRGALRKGMWKINHMNADDHGKGKWELFDLSTDPGEIHDLAESLPEKLAELVSDFDVYVKETGAIWGPPVDMEQPRSALPEGMIGGDPIADQRAWMHIGVGERFREGKAVA